MYMFFVLLCCGWPEKASHDMDQSHEDVVRRVFFVSFFPTSRTERFLSNFFKKKMLWNAFLKNIVV